MITCTICGLSFSRNFTLQRHLQTTHNSSRLACDSCDKTFSRWDVLQRHRKRRHAAQRLESCACDDVIASTPCLDRLQPVGTSQQSLTGKHVGCNELKGDRICTKDNALLAPGWPFVSDTVPYFAPSLNSPLCNFVEAEHAQVYNFVPEAAPSQFNFVLDELELDGRNPWLGSESYKSTTSLSASSTVSTSLTTSTSLTIPPEISPPTGSGTLGQYYMGYQDEQRICHQQQLYALVQKLDHFIFRAKCLPSLHLTPELWELVHDIQALFSNHDWPAVIETPASDKPERTHGRKGKAPQYASRNGDNSSRSANGCRRQRRGLSSTGRHTPLVNITLSASSKQSKRYRCPYYFFADADGNICTALKKWPRDVIKHIQKRTHGLFLCSSCSHSFQGPRAQSEYHSHTDNEHSCWRTRICIFVDCRNRGLEDAHTRIDGCPNDFNSLSDQAKWYAMFHLVAPPGTVPPPWNEVEVGVDAQSSAASDAPPETPRHALISSPAGSTYVQDLSPGPLQDVGAMFEVGHDSMTINWGALVASTNDPNMIYLINHLRSSVEALLLYTQRLVRADAILGLPPRGQQFSPFLSPELSMTETQVQNSLPVEQNLLRQHLENVRLNVQPIATSNSDHASDNTLMMDLPQEIELPEDLDVDVDRPENTPWGMEWDESFETSSNIFGTPSHSFEAPREQDTSDQGPSAPGGSSNHDTGYHSLSTRKE